MIIVAIQFPISLLFFLFTWLETYIYFIIIFCITCFGYSPIIFYSQKLGSCPGVVTCKTLPSGMKMLLRSCVSALIGHDKG